ncbi:MAG TPA: hypothetical protein VFB81_16365 [Myxococcales bacterium]|nr:hypothetical protein [Myxococcales bacterium]
MRRALPLLALAAALLGPGCARIPGAVAGLRERSELRAEVGTFELAYAAGDEASRDALERAIRAASPRLVRWGTLRVPVRVVILPTHEALEAVINRRDYEWLRAWARYDEIFVQSPRTWTFTGANPADVDELMLHELTHCLMYQRSAGGEDWMRKRIPLWFREGMASVTANQSYRWPALEDLARFYDERPDQDPVGKPESLYRGQNEIVYGAAHHAFAFLIRRYGEKAVERVMEGMAQGATFPDAFQQAIGLSAPAFVQDFRLFVRLRGFRPAGALGGPAPFLQPQESAGNPP